jgi:hypothetical protein
MFIEDTVNHCIEHGFYGWFAPYLHHQLEYPSLWGTPRLDPSSSPCFQLERQHEPDRPV